MIAQIANATLSTLYWQVGKRIHQEILGEKRARYGKRIVTAPGRQLETEFGSGFGEKNLRRMVQFAETFPAELGNVWMATVYRKHAYSPASADMRQVLYA